MTYWVQYFYRLNENMSVDEDNLKVYWCEFGNVDMETVRDQINQKVLPELGEGWHGSWWSIVTGDERLEKYLANLDDKPELCGFVEV